MSEGKRIVLGFIGLGFLWAAFHFGTVQAGARAVMAPLEPKSDASEQAQRMVSSFIDSPECNSIKNEILVAGKGKPSEGTTQHVLATLSMQAQEQGCVSH